MRVELRYILIFLLSVSSGFVIAQERDKNNELNAEKKEVKLEVTAPEQVRVGEQFRLVFNLMNAEASEIDFPDKIKGFDIVYGPALSTSSTTQVIKGKRTSYTMVSFSYFLVANETGKLRIPEASVTVKGKKYTAECPQIEVLSSGNRNEPAKRGKKGTPENRMEIKDKDAFIQAIVDNQDIDGQKIIEVTLRVFVSDRINIAGIYYDRSATREPDFSGFEVIGSWTSSQDGNMFKTEYNGKNYYAADIRKFQLLPKRSGKVEIEDGGQVDVVFGIKTGEVEQSFFGTMEKQVEVRKTLTVKPFTIDAGLVGDWQSL